MKEKYKRTRGRENKMINIRLRVRKLTKQKGMLQRHFAAVAFHTHRIVKKGKLKGVLQRFAAATSHTIKDKTALEKKCKSARCRKKEKSKRNQLFEMDLTTRLMT